MLVAPLVPEYVPAVHAEQTELPALEYKPAEHVKHMVLPSADEKVPAGHVVHSYCPVVGM